MNQEEFDRKLGQVCRWDGDRHHARAWVRLMADTTPAFIGDLRDLVFNHLAAGGSLGGLKTPDAHKLPVPDWAEFWTLDEVINCLNVGEGVCFRLGELFGNVPEDDRTPLGGDGTDGTVETPDGRMGDFADKLSRCWDGLSAWDQLTIVNAWKHDYEREG